MAKHKRDKEGFSLNANGERRKIGSGRKKGAKSFQLITLGELIDHFEGNRSASIEIGRLWGDANGINGVDVKPIKEKNPEVIVEDFSE